MEFLKPKRLEAGDTIATISLSDGAAGLFPHVTKLPRKISSNFLDSIVISTPHALKDPNWIYNNPKARAEDLHWALENPEVKGIISNIGGYESVRILPYINHDLIRKFPKIFMGFSDLTIQLIGLLNARVVSFQGPSMMAGIATLKAYPYMQESVRQTLFEGYTRLLKAAPFWNETNVDWADSDYAAKAHLQLNVRQGEGWLWLQGNSRTEGHLIGGCIEVLEMLKGTHWWSKPEMFKNAVLYLETSNDVPPPANVEYWLRNYASLGDFERYFCLVYCQSP